MATAGRKPVQHSGGIKPPVVRIRQKKGETKREFQKRVKAWKKGNKKWQEYEKAKRQAYNKKSYAKNKAKIKKRREAKKARQDYYGSNILGIDGFEKASKKERDRYYSNISKLKEAYAFMGQSFEKQMYKEYGKFINNENSKSMTDKLSKLNDKLENDLARLLQQRDELSEQLDRWEEIEDDW